MTNDNLTFHARRLTEARVAKGFTMSGLGEMANLSAQTVSALENGTRKPTADVLVLLSRALGVSVRYFKEDREFPVTTESAVFFRSSASSRTRRNQDMRKQHSVWVYEVASWLDKLVALPQFDSQQFWNGVPKPDVVEEITDAEEPTSRYSEEAIEEAAVGLRESWNMGTGPIPDLVKLLESKGIRVVRQPAGSTKLDAYSTVLNGQPMIFLSSDKESGPRSRFDAAHELGHLLLHPHLSSTEISNPTTLKRIEEEANYFAGAFLLPESSFSREIHGVTLGAFLAMKPRWKVSAQAFIRRAYNLGAIDPYQYNRLCVDISARGMRKREPHDDAILAEVPVVIRDAWNLLIKHAAVSRGQILEDLQLPPDFLAATLGVPITAFDTENVIQLGIRAS